MLDLELLNNWSKYTDTGDEWEQKFHDMMEKYYLEASNEKDLTFFDELLIKYYKNIFDILTDNPDIKDQNIMEDFSTWIDESSKEPDRNIYKGYLLWNFTDIKEAIDSLGGEEPLEKQFKMQYLTAHAISFRDKYDMQILGRSESI